MGRGGPSGRATAWIFSVWAISAIGILVLIAAQYRWCQCWQCTAFTPACLQVINRAAEVVVPSCHAVQVEGTAAAAMLLRQLQWPQHGGRFQYTCRTAPGMQCCGTELGLRVCSCTDCEDSLQVFLLVLLPVPKATAWRLLHAHCKAGWDRQAAHTGWGPSACCM